GARRASDLAGDLGIPVKRIQRHLSRLTSVGIARIERDRRTYVLLPDALRQAAKSLSPSRDPGLALGAVDEEEEAVLRHYFGGGTPRLHQSRARRGSRDRTVRRCLGAQGARAARRLL